MDGSKALRPIIIKKKKVIAGGGHHGGAWKVAMECPSFKLPGAGSAPIDPTCFRRLTRNVLLTPVTSSFGPSRHLGQVQGHTGSESSNNPLRKNGFSRGF